MNDECYLTYVPCSYEEGYVIGYFYAISEEDALKMAEKEEPSGEDVEVYTYRCKELDGMQGKFRYGKNPHFVDVTEEENVKILKELGFALERDGYYMFFGEKRISNEKSR